MSDCIFCSLKEWIAESEFCYAVLDINPRQKHHTLIITKQHFSDLSSTPSHIINDIFILVQEIVEQLKKQNPDILGFNYISNEGKAAGQEILHTHVHIIPRYLVK